MKFTKFFAIILLFVTASMNGQEIADHALGLRLGDSDGLGAQISYQKAIGRYTRAEFDLGFQDSRKFNAFKLAGLFQWVYNIDGIFNWYYGAGAGAGSVKFKPIPDSNNPNIPVELDGGFYAFAAGNIGVEANLNMPLVISLDIRPELGLIGYSNFENKFNFDVALGVRYQF